MAEAAKRNGSRVILMATVPMSFESERRKTAIDALNGLRKICDISVVIDSDRLARIDPMLGVREAFSVLDQMVCEAFMGMMEMLESSDGESLFQSMKGKMFTVSFAEGMNVGKVADMLANGPMVSSKVTSQPMIFVRGNIPPDGSERMIASRISESTGHEPMFVQGPAGRGMNLVMFAPFSDLSCL
jgi:cell division GTPase FtsZ